MEIETVTYVTGRNSGPVWRCYECDRRMPVVDDAVAPGESVVIECGKCDRSLVLQNVNRVTRLRFIITLASP